MERGQKVYQLVQDALARRSPADLAHAVVELHAARLDSLRRVKVPGEDLCNWAVGEACNLGAFLPPRLPRSERRVWRALG